jgi:TRAP-type C4-dicarboxylate transport system substrate-binding protein
VVQEYRKMVADIYQATGKQLKINIYAAGELPYKPMDGIKITATNKVQMSDGAVGFLAGDVPEFNVFGMPFVSTTFEGIFKSLKSIEPIIDQKLLKKFKLGVLFHWTMPPQNLWTVKQVNTLADLKGKKIRAWNPEQVTMLRLLGATPVSISSAEVPTSLQRGVIDGAITSALSVSDWKIYDFVNYGLMINFSMGHQVVLFNMAEYNKLPADVQRTLMKKGGEWYEKFKAVTPIFEKEARANLLKHGMTLNEISPEDLKKAKKTMRSMWDDWTEKRGPLAKELLDTVTKSMAQ